MRERRNPGRVGRFSGRLAAALPRALRRPGRILGQVFANIRRMAVPAVIAGALVGALLAGYGRDPASLGASAATLLARDLGPVLLALLFAGHVGLALALDMDRMRRSDQLAALEMMGLDPFDRVIAPRAAAAMLSLPLLGVLFVAAGVGGSCATAAGILELDPRAFWTQAARVLPELAAVGAIKTVVFGLVVGWIALSAGHGEPDASGVVARRLPRMVAHASLVVLALEAAFIIAPMALP